MDTPACENTPACDKAQNQDFRLQSSGRGSHLVSWQSSFDCHCSLSPKLTKAQGILARIPYCFAVGMLAETLARVTEVSVQVCDGEGTSMEIFPEFLEELKRVKDAGDRALLARLMTWRVVAPGTTSQQRPCSIPAV